MVLRHLIKASIEKFRNAEAIGSGYSLPMALFRLSISLPDRPGSLGLLASAIGASGGDIRGLVVLKSEDGRGYDDITVAVPGSDPTDLLNVLSAIGGVEVISITPVE